MYIYIPRRVAINQQRCLLRVSKAMWAYRLRNSITVDIFIRLLEVPDAYKVCRKLRTPQQWKCPSYIQLCLKHARGNRSLKNLIAMSFVRLFETHTVRKQSRRKGNSTTLKRFPPISLEMPQTTCKVSHTRRLKSSTATQIEVCTSQNPSSMLQPLLCQGRERRCHDTDNREFLIECGQLSEPQGAARAQFREHGRTLTLQQGEQFWIQDSFCGEVSQFLDLTVS